MAQNVPEELIDTIQRGISCTNCARLRDAWVRERTRNVNRDGLATTESYYVFECSHCDDEWEIPNDHDFELTFSIATRDGQFQTLARLVDRGRELGADPRTSVEHNRETGQFTVHIPAARVAQALELKAAVNNLTAKEVNSHV